MFFLILACLSFPRYTLAQHLRIFACAIANDSAGAFMGGSSNGSGLYQSDDTGKTWRHLGWDNIKCYSMDEVQSSNGRILYEATGLGVLRSTDFGEHWKQLTDWRISEVMDVALNQKNPKEIYVATSHGPWHTTDLGSSWIPDRIPFNTQYCSRVKYDSAMMNGFFIAGEDGIASVTSKGWTVKLRVASMRDIEELGLNSSADFGVWYAISEREVLYHLSDSSAQFRLYDSDRTADAWCTNTFEGNEFYRLIGGRHGLTSTISGLDYGSSVSDSTTRNVSSCLFVDTPYTEKLALAASLGTGVVLFLSTGHSLTPLEYYLPKRQIWTLKSFLVTP